MRFISVRYTVRGACARVCLFVSIFSHPPSSFCSAVKDIHASVDAKATHDFGSLKIT